MSLTPALPRRAAGAAVALLLFAGGCDEDTADLVKEINDAREGCTQEGLKAGTEQCVTMMERYAEMGTEVMHTTIGAVKSLDQALERMPPPAFDTVGVGAAIRVPLGDAATETGLAPSSPSFQRSPGGAARSSPGGSGWEERAGEERRSSPDLSGWGEAAAYGEPVRGEYPSQPGWRDPEAGNGAGAARPSGGRGEGGAWGGDARAPEAAAPRRAAPGVLLPPGERLDRPWLREDAAERERAAPRRRPESEHEQDDRTERRRRPDF